MRGGNVGARRIYAPQLGDERHPDMPLACRQEAGMATAFFSAAVAIFGGLAMASAEAGAALGLFAFLGLWLGKRAFSDM